MAGPSRGKPPQIPFPLSSFPGSSLYTLGDNNQESAGRIINRYAEPLGEGDNPTGPAAQIWRRSPGLTRFASTGNTTYRGGLIVGGLSYEVWNGNLSTVDQNGNVTSLGSISGSDPVSIARDLAGSIDVVVVSPNNGAFASTGGGAPAAYNGGGNLPAPNSVAFQDGIFHFTIADGRVFGSGLNALTQNTQTFVKLQAKSDVALLRGIPFNGMMYFFTTGGCEVWNDAALAFPAYPYQKFMTLPWGLVQGSAIAGFETGFDDLIWVAQDYNVYRLIYNTLQPGPTISPPALNVLIEKAVKAGDTLRAGCFIAAGRKFWYLKAETAGWSWEYNLASGRWAERRSLIPSTGNQGLWRALGGHNAFGKWLVGDEQSGNLLFVDSANFTEDGAPLLSRIESGPTNAFPGKTRIARADFNFVFGVGDNVGQLTMPVQSIGPSGTFPLIVVQVASTAQMKTGDQVNISGVLGTTEANGTWVIQVIGPVNFNLLGSTFVHNYVSGGTIVDVTARDNQINPSCAVSCSKDGGITWDNPSVRALGTQRRIKGVRVSIKSRGLSETEGVRWRVDCSDPVYDGFLGGTMSSDPRESAP